jgi:hypothetical protein
MKQKTLLDFNNELLDGFLVEIRPNIYSVVIHDDYDRAMLFCRYQEFYESPYKEIKGKYFTLEYFMRLYTKKRKSKMFTYPEDWSGYNLPSDIFQEAHSIFQDDKDIYNQVMNVIFMSITNHRKDKNKYYLIGVDSLKSKTLKHEIAHGFYYTDFNYKHDMDEIIKTISAECYGHLKKQLVSFGYMNDDKIIYDEIQAFLSTETKDDIIEFLHISQHKQIKKVFNRYYQNHLPLG